MKCKRYHRDIIDKLYGELSSRRLRRLEKHLATCDNCRRELEEMEQILRIARSTRGTTVAVDTSYIDAQLKLIAAAEADAAGSRRQTHSLKEILVRPFPAALAAGMLVAIVTAVFIGRHGMPSGFNQPAVPHLERHTMEMPPAENMESIKSIGYSTTSPEPDTQKILRPQKDKQANNITSTHPMNDNFFSLRRRVGKTEEKKAWSHQIGGNAQSEMKNQRAPKQKPALPDIPAADQEGSIPESGSGCTAPMVFWRSSADETPVLSKSDDVLPSILYFSYPKSIRNMPREQPRKTMVIKAVIDKTGKLLSAVVIKGISPSIDKSLLDAMGEWRFAPGTHKGIPIRCIVNIRITIPPEQ